MQAVRCCGTGGGQGVGSGWRTLPPVEDSTNMR